jgi:hypothetical protein
MTNEEIKLKFPIGCTVERIKGKHNHMSKFQQAKVVGYSEKYHNINLDVFTGGHEPENFKVISLPQVEIILW